MILVQLKQSIIKIKAYLILVIYINLGSRYYRAPELILGSNSYGCEVDIWAAGCIFAEAIL